MGFGIYTPHFQTQSPCDLQLMVFQPPTLDFAGKGASNASNSVTHIDQVINLQ